MGLEGRSQIVEHRSKGVAGTTQSLDGLRGQMVDHRVEQSEQLVERRAQMGLEGREQMAERRLMRVAERTQSVDGLRGQRVDGRSQSVD